MHDLKKLKNRATAGSTAPLHPIRHKTVSLSLLILALPGCEAGRPETYPVHGVITQYDGEPLNGGFVLFTTDTEQFGQVVAQGQVAEDGSFQLSTYVFNDGAVAGLQRVTLRPSMAGGEAGAFAPSPIHKKYTALETTDLEFQITEGPNEINIQLERPKE